MSAIRVLIADDHPIVRKGLGALLDSLEGIRVTDLVTTGREAVDKVISNRPDVAIIDLQMPDLDGYQATREIARLAPSVAVLVLTMFDDDASIFAAMQAGARGYLVKGAEQDEIEGAIRALARGEAIFGPGVAERVLGFLSKPQADDYQFPQLNERERKILDLLACGLSNLAIGERLGIASKTVANNASCIFVKLQVADRAEAIIRARDAGLGKGSRS